MKKKNKIILITIILVILTCVVSIGYSMQKTNILESDRIINISECSEEFMNHYFEQISEIPETNEENVLIITSKEKIKDGYGATEIIEAPNNQYFLQYESEEEKDNALDLFRKDEKIINAEENMYHQICDFNSWGIEKMGLDEASTEVNGRNLNSITVAIIDTGCDMDLFNQYYEGKIVDTYNAVAPDEAMVDENGHGTHIAGTIAEGTPDNVKILPVKVSRKSSISTLKIIEAINYITYYHKADVINMSYGSYSESKAEKEAVDAAAAENIICVAAAGNDNLSLKHYPSSWDNTISIASCDSELKKSSFSNFGNTITFTAPGSSILSINGTKSGTSMATPHAVCAAAILKSYNPDYTMDDIVNILKYYAKDLGAKGKDIYFGYGFINLKDIPYCDCNCATCKCIYCEGCDCEDCTFNIVEKQISRIEVPYAIVLDYNYGSITNLSATPVKIYYTDNTFETKYLLDLEDCEISGYDPYCYTNQTITIRYQGKEATVDLNKGSEYEYGWEYETINSTDIMLTEYKPCIYGNGLQIEKMYIPEKIDGYNVTALGGNLFDSVSGMKKMVVPEKVVDVGSETFWNTSLEEIDFKASAIEVGDYAFGYAEKIETINATIKSAGEYAFCNCLSLKNVTLANDTTIIKDGVFEGCISLTSINLPDSVFRIGSYAFCKTGLQSIYLPEGITTISESTFESCSELKIVNLPDSLTTIEEDAFRRCSNLESIFIPQNVSTIELDAFNHCSSLSYISVDERNQVYDSRDYCNAIIETETNRLIVGTAETEIPDTVKIIGEDAFEGNFILWHLEVPEGVEIIEDYAFYDCENFEYLFLPRSVTSIGTSVFSYDYYITLYVYSDSYAKTYAVDNNLEYMCLDPNLVTVYLSNKDYKAFETVNEEGMYFNLKYDDGRTELIEEGITITYTGDNESFRYGDAYFTASAYTEFDEYVETQVDVNVTKARPEINIPTNLHAENGQKLAEITLPSGFAWMEPDTLISGSGNVNYKAKYIPEDEINYEIVENIDIPVYVSDVNPDKPTSLTVVGTYTYDESLKVVQIDGFNSETMNISNNAYISAGNYVANISSKTGKWSDGTTDILDVEWSIQKREINIPKINDHFTYNGTEINFAHITLPDSSILNYVTFSGDTRATVAGEYNLIMTLKDSNNNKWKNTDETSISFTWVIEKLTIEPTIIIIDKIYDGTCNIDQSSVVVTDFNLNKDDYTIVSVRLITPDVGNNNAVVTIKLTDEKFKNYCLKNGNQEYEYNVNVKVKPIETVSLDRIIISNPPTKVVYNEGESFDPSGMEVKAIYSDDSEEVIDDYEIIVNNPLRADDTSVTIRYTIDDITKEATQNITVNRIDTDLKFQDVPKGSWYYESVKYVSEKGIITGYNETTFGPFNNLTREQLVNILWRIEGRPDASELENIFSDVPNETWYTDAIKWASANEIVKGYGGTTLFGVGDNIIRQDLAIMLKKYAEYKEKYFEPTVTLDNFADKETVSNYAVEAVSWASENGIISGNNNSDGTRTIAPLNNAMRCEAAVMLMRFCENIL